MTPCCKVGKGADRLALLQLMIDPSHWRDQELAFLRTCGGTKIKRGRGLHGIAAKTQWPPVVRWGRIIIGISAT